MSRIAGVDEAGRGPLAGPVVAAAVMLGESSLTGLTDSKALSAGRRTLLASRIQEDALAWSVVAIEAGEIDRINILQATLTAMHRAIASLRLSPAHVIVDGNRLPALDASAEARIGADATVPCVSAASILAKVHRDRLMIAWDQHYPAYGFAQHKGYGTQAHRRALQQFGPCPLHRYSFRPVANASRTPLAVRS